MSVDAIKKFLENAKDYPDQTMVTIGETQVPLGSLRQLNASDREALSTAMKANEDKGRELDGQRAKVIDLAQKAQAAHDAAQEALRKASAAPPPNPGADPFADPWLAPVKKELDTRDAAFTELKNMIGQMANTVKNAATIFAEERWDNQYNGINFGKREKKPTRAEILEFATANKIVDRHGMPSISGAWDKMSEADRLKEAEDRAREQGREEGRMAALATRIPMPGVPGPGQATPMPKSPSGELGDLYSEAIKDPELRALIEQLPS